MSEQGEAELFVMDIDGTTERWVVVDYWYYPDDAEGRHFTATVHDMPVAFD
jgi:hypothetical protein